MPVRDRLRILALSAVVGSCLMVVPAAAEDCIGISCEPAAATPAPQQPLALKSFRRRPVALGKPTRILKMPKGDYVRAKLARRTKPKPAAEHQTPQFMPVVVSPEAAAALAMQASIAQAAAEVRLVEADEFNELDRAADTPLASDTPLMPVRVPTSNEPAFQMASADQTDEPNTDGMPAPAAPSAMPSDRIASAFAPLAMPPDQTSPTAAAPTVAVDRIAPISTPVAEPPAAGPRAWLSQLASWFSDMLSRLTATVRRLFG